MARSQTQDRISEFREVFSLIDKDSDGLVSIEELDTLIRLLDGNPTKEVEDVISEVIDFQEFLNIMGQKVKENAGEELKEAFKVLDRNQDGYISANELRQVMINLGEKLTKEEAQLMIREADLDGDGLVSFDEFSRMMIPNF